MNLKRHAISLAISIVLLSGGGKAWSANLFDLSMDLGGAPVQNGYNSVSGALDSLDGARIQTFFPAYNPLTDALNISVKFRGLPGPVTVTSAIGSPDLTLTIPDTGFTKTFTGLTRDASNTALKDWFKKDGGAEVDKLTRKLAELTPSDPLAGNPNSLMSRTIACSFDRGFMNKASMINSPEQASAPGTSGVNPNLVPLGVGYMNLKQKTANQGTYNASSYSLPFGYTWVLGNPQQQISFDLPVTYMDVQGGQAYSLSPGLSYSHPLNDNWVITPSINYGAMFSMDMGAAGHVLNTAVTSAYTYPTDVFSVHLGNMAGYVTTIPIKTGEYSSDPDISEFNIKNGVMVYVPTQQLLANTGVELFVLDTRMFGTKLFNQGYTELGLSYGFTKRYTTSLRLGASYMLAKDNNGFSVNFGYTF